MLINLKTACFSLLFITSIHASAQNVCGSKPCESIGRVASKGFYSMGYIQCGTKSVLDPIAAVGSYVLDTKKCEDENDPAFIHTFGEVFVRLPLDASNVGGPGATIFVDVFRQTFNKSDGRLSSQGPSTLPYLGAGCSDPLEVIGTDAKCHCINPYVWNDKSAQGARCSVSSGNDRQPVRKRPRSRDRG